MRLATSIVLLAAAAAALGLAEAHQDSHDPATGPGIVFPTVEAMGTHLTISSVKGSVSVHDRSAGQPPPSKPNVTTTRTVTVLGMSRPASIEQAEDSRPLPTAVMRSRVIAMEGDGQPIDFEVARRDQRWTASQRRRNLVQTLVNNPHLIMNPPKGTDPANLRRIRFGPSGFNATANVRRVPQQLDRMALKLDVVGARGMEIARLPLEAMEEHEEIAPGVRFLVRHVTDVANADRAMKRVALEYFIERSGKDAPGETEPDAYEFETTPLLAAIAIRDAKGTVLGQVHHPAETE
ncbi:MAG: hypothetical protein AAFV77_04675, partial [Planctomycetota bacterium]